ncbi:hypothetical protein, partial [Bacillus cereus]|uniref:hypothetical protein n=1 Tax=Bacillus cereus TaxID=1396 RepID=UPI001C3E6948
MSKTALFYSQVLKNKSDAKRHRTYFLNLMAMAHIGSLFSRVSGGHRCPQLPSEPYVTVSHHTAQAFFLSD